MRSASPATFFRDLNEVYKHDNLHFLSTRASLFAIFGVQ
jgi:hypothetical protein